MRLKELARPAGGGGFGQFKPGPEERVGKYLPSLFEEFASRDGLIQVKLENGEFGLSALRNYLLPGMLDAHSYTSADVEAFSLVAQGLPGARGHLVSPFLTQLIISGKDADYVLHTSGEPLDYLLRLNDKNVVVRGPVGNFACSGMRGGHVRLEGPSGSHLGQYMEGGRIDASGPADHSFLGYGLKGGQVCVGGVIAAGK